MTSLDEEIEDEIIQHVKTMFKQERENKTAESLETAKGLIKILQQMIDTNEEIKRDFGIYAPYTRLEYTGEKLGGFRLFKVKEDKK